MYVQVSNFFLPYIIEYQTHVRDTKDCIFLCRWKFATLKMQINKISLATFLQPLSKSLRQHNSDLGGRWVTPPVTIFFLLCLFINKVFDLWIIFSFLPFSGSVFPLGTLLYFAMAIFCFVSFTNHSRLASSCPYLSRDDLFFLFCLKN